MRSSFPGLSSNDILATPSSGKEDAVKRPVIKFINARVIPDKLPQFDHRAILFVYSVDGVVIRQVHWSGRFDGDVEDMARWLRYLARSLGADLVSTTETQQKDALKVIRETFSDAWGFDKIGEYVLGFRKADFRRSRAVKPRKIIATAIPRWAQWRQMHVAYFMLRHKDLKRWFRVIDIHGPSGIEHGGSFKPGKASQVAQKGWPKVGRNMRRFNRRRPHSVQVVVADANGNHFDPFWMDYFEEALGAPVIWRYDLPALGTHGSGKGRLIDAAWILNMQQEES